MKETGMTNAIANLWPYRLRRGHSADPSQGACAVDASNWLQYGRHGDDMPCSSPTLRSTVIATNDETTDGVRQRLLGFLHRLPRSRSVAHEEARVRVVWLAAVRVIAPLALDAAGMFDHAADLRALPDDVSAHQAWWDAERVTSAVKVSCLKSLKTGRMGLMDTAAWSVKWAALAARAADRLGVSRPGEVAAPAAGSATAAGAAQVMAEYTAASARAAVARRAAGAAKACKAWDAWFVVLDEAFNAGPQGTEPWSAVQIEAGAAAYVRAGGLVNLAEVDA